MKPAIDTNSKSMVEYPSAIFPLERHEIYPYERFTYNILRIAIEALNAKKLPLNIYVSFSDGVKEGTWWGFNAGINKICFPTGQVLGFRISTTPLSPLLIFAISHCIGRKIFDDDKKEEIFKKPFLFGNVLKEVGNNFTEALKEYKNKGLASSIRKFTNLSNINVFDIQDSCNYFDVCSQFIANHEIAHAYVGQLTKKIKKLSSKDLRAFEYIVDILATQWVYNQMIINTPDTDEYRKFRGTTSHSESIYVNALYVIEGQILNFLLFVFAGALINKGKIYLDGGDVHPHSLFRLMMQHVHFMTLLESNFSSILTKTQIKNIDAQFNSFMWLFTHAGLFSLKDIEIFNDKRRFDDFGYAYKLVNIYKIKELYSCNETFKIAEKLGDDIKKGESLKLFNIKK